MPLSSLTKLWWPGRRRTLRPVTPAITFRPSTFAPARVVHRVPELIHQAVKAVEAHTGETVPPLIITVAGRPGMATAQLRAADWRRARLRDTAAYWKYSYQQAAGALAYTSVTRTDQVLIALNGPQLQQRPDELLPTLVHELTHAIQTARPGRRTELRAGLDSNLRITVDPLGLHDAMAAVVAIEEAEAYAVEYALDPDADDEPPFDREAVHRRLVDAAAHWKAASDPREDAEAATTNGLGGATGADAFRYALADGLTAALSPANATS